MEKERKTRQKELFHEKRLEQKKLDVKIPKPPKKHIDPEKLREAIKLKQAELPGTKKKSVKLKNTRRYLHASELEKENPVKRDNTRLRKEINEAIFNSESEEIPMEIIVKPTGKKDIGAWTKRPVPNREDLTITSRMEPLSKEERKRIETMRKKARNKNKPNRFKELVKKMKKQNKLKGNNP